MVSVVVLRESVDKLKNYCESVLKGRAVVEALDEEYYTVECIVGSKRFLLTDFGDIKGRFVIIGRDYDVEEAGIVASSNSFNEIIATWDKVEEPKVLVDVKEGVKIIPAPPVKPKEEVKLEEGKLFYLPGYEWLTKRLDIPSRKIYIRSPRR